MITIFRTCVLVCGFLLSHTLSAQIIITPIEPIDPIIFYPLYDPDYGKECTSRRLFGQDTVLTGNITITEAGSFSEYRCIKRINGNLTIDFSHNTSVKKVYFRWLETINGDLTLTGGARFEKGVFSKLQSVDGDIFIDNRHRSPRWLFPSLKKHGGYLEVLAGVTNDLSGFSALEVLGRLYLRNHPNDIWGPFSFTGLNSVTDIGNIRYSLRMGETTGAFLEKLTSIHNDIEVYIKESGLFGFESVESIGGKLNVEGTSYMYNLSHFASLLELNGLILNDNASLNDVSILQGISFPSNGYIKIVNNSVLANCDAKSLVRDLRQAPSWNSFHGSNTYVYGNGYPDCN